MSVIPTGQSTAGKRIDAMSSSYPFAQWGIDLVGPFKKSINQKTFIVVAIDYFTKWAEAEALSTITTRTIKKFVFSRIICRFGVPMSIVSDNGM